MSVALIIPTHNDENVIKPVVEDILQNMQAYKISQVILVENGSKDKTADACRQLAAKYPQKIVALSIQNAGIGFAYYEGLKYLNSDTHCEVKWALLSASDLPFGYSDLQAFMEQEAHQEISKNIFIGSKAHLQSDLKRTIKRNFVSFIFRIMRFACLGLQVGDTQGTFFLPRESWPLCLKTASRDFFFTTELTFNLHNDGYTITELPIVLRPEIRPSTVKPFKHGLALLKQMLLLRFR